MIATEREETPRQRAQGIRCGQKPGNIGLGKIACQKLHCVYKRLHYFGLTGRALHGILASALHSGSVPMNPYPCIAYPHTGTLLLVARAHFQQL